MERNISKVILIILDGFGLAARGPGNPITAKLMPFMDKLISTYQNFTLVAAGLVVGLEWGNYGNSEVGHGAMGTGRVVVQTITRINKDIRNGKFFKNEAFMAVLEHVKKHNSKVHIIGLVSPGGIHSHEGHLVGLLDFFAQNGFSRVNVHMITDGEDSVPDEAVKSLKRIDKALKKAHAKIATIGGRNFGMDRVKNWPLIKKAWEAMVHAEGEKYKSPEDYIKNSYKKGIYDPEIVPAVLEGADTKIEDGDGIIFFNFRNDRMRQIVASFVLPEFNEFDRGKVPKDILVATMTDYDERFKVLVAYVAYPAEVFLNTLGEVISKEGLKQLRIAESEKEAHVTNFFNGGKLGAYPGEERIIATSRSMRGNEYLEHPEMSAAKITESVIDSLTKPYSLIVVNFANTDMVAHTGSFEAVEKALPVIDESVRKIVQSADPEKTLIAITADHGNSEELIDPSTGKPDTQHSTANVPIIFINNQFKKHSDRNLDNLYQKTPAGSLIDVAPTLLNILDIKKPKEMTGSNILH